MASSLPALPAPDALGFHTERLDLLPITREHAAEMFGVLNDPGLYQYTGDSPRKNVEALARQYELWEARVSPDGSELWLNWVMRLRESGRLIGYLQAGVSPGHTEVAWVLGAPWQHRGYATEAAEGMVGWLLQLRVRDVRASIHPDHEASIGVAERLGLRKTPDNDGVEFIWKRIYEGPDHP